MVQSQKIMLLGYLKIFLICMQDLPQIIMNCFQMREIAMVL
ncbi:MAG: hypothetical protein GX783_12945 [Clostridiales bacterium]|nr:hypothetical protein [Clostridiales bacterium]